jgi:hypothetical protein
MMKQFPMIRSVTKPQMSGVAGQGAVRVRAGTGGCRLSGRVTGAVLPQQKSCQRRSLLHPARVLGAN